MSVRLRKIDSLQSAGKNKLKGTGLNTLDVYSRVVEMVGLGQNYSLYSN